MYECQVDRGWTCDGLFYVLIWLHQIFGQIIFYSFLWRYFFLSFFFLQMKVTDKSVDFVWIWLLSLMWWDSSNQLKALIGKKFVLTMKKKFCQQTVFGLCLKLFPTCLFSILWMCQTFTIHESSPHELLVLFLRSMLMTTESYLYLCVMRTFRFMLPKPSFSESFNTFSLLSDMSDTTSLLTLQNTAYL